MFEQTRYKLAALISPELVEQRDTATRAANTDPLTGLANRRAFDLASATANDDPHTCIILFDANNFGQVNKLASYDEGDQVLIDIAEALIEVARRCGLASRVFRLGGDEFAILAPCRFAEAIRDRCEKQFKPRMFGAVRVTISGTTGKTVAEADQSLQARKAARKGNTL